MADDKTITGGEDRDRIDVHDDDELRRWARKFGVDTDALREAVATAGTRADDVEKHLQSKPMPPDPNVTR